MRISTGLLRLIACATLLLLVSHSQGQGNLVRNGGFERTFDGWAGTVGYLPAVGFAYEGKSVGAVIDVGHSSIGQTAHQMLSTIPGTSYSLSFALLSGEGRAGEQSPPGASPVRVTWAGQVLGEVANPSASAWQLFSYEVTAFSDRTELNFASLGTRWQLIDDVRVVAVPEPSAVSLGVGAVLLLVAKRRVRRVDRLVRCSHRG